ncbi:MAG: phosphoglucosamine mutase [Bacteroidia bacterium]
MTLIKSISGIRGTIGGTPGTGLTPLDTIIYTSAYAQWLSHRAGTDRRLKVVIGRDSRISGEMVSKLVIGCLTGCGIDVIDLGLSTTPTVEIAVTDLKADGGIIITASHNPKQWNALKLLNEKGEFISADDGALILKYAEEKEFSYASVNNIGTYKEDNTFIQKHIDKVLTLDLVDADAIKAKNFKIVIDCVNSSGALVLPDLLRALGVKEIIELNCEANGQFAHNPEPLPENLLEIPKAVSKNNAHLGIAVDPDVDRLALICEDGEMFGEEYTLVAVADYVLQNTKKKDKITVSNLSSTLALREITEKDGGQYFASAVGEVNVVSMMKEKNAVIGGEGNGGIIYPELHYGRDALVGIALFLTHLAKFGKSCSMLRARYPNYYMSKNKIELSPEMNVGEILQKIQAKYKKQQINTIDGVKIEFDKEWVHLRASNTEPIIRIYSESTTMTTAEKLSEKLMMDIKDMITENNLTQ